MLQLDAARVAGVNENIDFVAVSGRLDDRVIEYVDHLHDHFADPAVVSGGRYRTPLRPGFSAQLLDTSLAEYCYPDGPAWTPARAALLQP